MKTPKHFDKYLHFVIALVCALFSPLFTLGGIVGKELGDFTSYGWADLKSKDPARMRAYAVNLVLDLVAGVCGLLIGALLT